MNEAKAEKNRKDTYSETILSPDHSKRGLNPAFRTVLLLGLAYMAGGLLSSVMTTDYTAVISDDLGIARAAFSATSTIHYGVCFFLTLFLYKITERVPLKLIIAAGAALSMTKVLLYAVSHSIVLFYIGSAVGGIANVFTGAVTLSIIIKRWFRDSQGMALSVATAFTGLGGMLLNPVMGRIVTYFGWRTGYLADSGLCLLITLLLILFLKTEPESAGTVPFQSKKSDRNETGSEVLKPVTTRENADTITSLLMIVLFFIASVAMVGVYTAMVPILQDIGYSLLFAAGVATSILAGANLAGKLLIGWVNDRLGVRMVMIIWFAGCIFSSCYFLIFRGISQPIALLGCLAVGMTAVVSQPPIPLICTALYRSEAAYGKAVSQCMASSFLGIAICLPVFHGIYDIFGSYVMSLRLALCMMLVSAGLAFVIIYRNRDLL